MDPIGPCYGKAIDAVILLFRKELGYLVHYEENFEELKTIMEKLQGSRQTTLHWIEEEERKHGNERENYVQYWLDGTDKLNEEAKNLDKDPHRTRARCHHWWLCPNLKWRRKLSKMAKEMAIDADKLEKLGGFLRVTFSSPTDYLESFNGALAFESRKSVMNDTIKALAGPKERIIGVYGLGGVGKTTFVRQVANKLKMDKFFNVVVEAKVGENPQINKIQYAIAELLGMELKEQSVIKRADRIRKTIEKEKSILIILDDVRTKIELEEVGIPDPSKMKLEAAGGKYATAMSDNVVCKILMTSKSEDALNEMGSERNLSINPLREEEAWSLFEVMADLDVNGRNRSLQKIAHEVAKQCKGMPVVISTMAKTLKKGKIKDWKSALKKLKSAENKQIQEMVKSALELCYQRLDSDDVKTLLLLCSVSNIRLVSDLLKYGIGLGIFKGSKTVEEARENLHQMISSLKASCLFMDDSSMELIKMNDTIREVAIKIATKNQYFFTKEGDPDLEEWPVDDLKRCPIITLIGDCIQELPEEKLDCPEIKLFYLSHPKNRSLMIPSSFFDGMGNLKVLDLTGMFIPSLPTSFSSITKLETLCLDHCDLQDISGIGALKNLKILSLLRSSMMQLPSEIGKLTRLRMLDLSNSKIETIPPNVLSKLIRLEELHMGDCSIKWEVENSTHHQRKNASLAELKHLVNLTSLEIQIHDPKMLPKKLKFEKLEKYRIFIGDIWDWSENNEVSTTLKIKLGFGIHLVQWVKDLIKGVENLYLDEITDISNVVDQINENDPLKHLHIQNNANIHHIVDSSKKKQAQFFFPNLETLELNNLSKLEKICHGPFMQNSFSKLRAIKVGNCDQLECLLLVSMVKALSQLVEIEVSECKSMKKIVSLECEDDGTTMDKIDFTPLKSLILENLPKMDDFCSKDDQLVSSFFSAKLAFPNLKTLKLSSMNLKRIWDDHQISSLGYSAFRNLANLTVEDCGGLKYLFSSLMLNSLSNLKQLEISKCHMMEDIIATETRNNIELSEVPLPKLEKITIKDMKNLKAVWHKQFEKLKILEVISCDKIGNIFPSHMQTTYQSLETLTVSDCNSVEEIFELGANYGESITTQLKQLTLLRLPNLKRIWNYKDLPKIYNSFHNLHFVCVEDCGDLEYLFPFSIAMSLRQVEEISLKQAFMMKEIVSKNDQEGPVSNYNPVVQFEFDNLNSLVLSNLHQLKTFYAGNHSLACPSLRKLAVFNCEKLKFFKTQQLTSDQGRICDSKIHVSALQTYFSDVDKVIENLEVWALNDDDANAIFQCQLSMNQFEKLKALRVSMSKKEATFPYWFLQNKSNLESLVVEWSSFKEIFQYERLKGENNENFEIGTQIKDLMLHGLHNLEYICKEGCEIDPILKALENIFICQCSSIKHLVPSSIAFNHLTYLEVEKCNGLVNLITSSTARSMAKLSVMKVRECNSLEHIIVGEEDHRDDEDAAKKEIVFTDLEILELECLPRLKKFCGSECSLNLPLLEKVVVRQCPRMDKFSNGETIATRLSKVVVEENGEEHWEGALNPTIEKMSKELVVFRSFKHLELSEYHELLGELWYGQQVENKSIFSNLKSLVVQKCHFVSDVLLTSSLLQALHNLEELDVRDCDSVQVVFDLNGINEQQTHAIMKKTILLKKIIVSNLLALKHIWRFEEEDEVDASEKTLHFHNLQAMRIEDCPNLEYLFPFSIAMDIPKLEELYVDSCGLKEIVAKKLHGSMDEETPMFVFDHLTSLDLRNLYELTGFYGGIHSFKCQLLKRMNVFDCKKLKLFNIQPKRCGESSASEEHHNFSVPQSLFSSEEVIGNLEELTLNHEDTNTILQGQIPWDLFSKLKILALSKFENDEANFPHLLLQNIPTIDFLVVEFCSFKEIFYNDERLSQDKEKEEEIEIIISIHLKTLGLRYLHNLQHICKEGFQIHPSLKILEILIVEQCSSLTHLVPSSVNFTYLKSLLVEDCERLVRLISSSTATSLVNLKVMEIARCNLLEQIVAEEEDDETKDEIAFRSLVTLKLVCLPNLNSFSSSKCLLRFPLLEEVLVKQCQSMRMFSHGETSTPELEKVLVEENDEEYYWEGDLNNTISKIVSDMESATASIVLDKIEEDEGQAKVEEEEKSGDLNESPMVQDAGDQLHDSEIPSGENLLNQTTASAIADKTETIKRPLAHEECPQNAPSLKDASVQDAVTIEDRKIEDIERPNEITIHERGIPPNENFFTQTKISAITAKNNETTVDEAEKISETIEKPLVGADPDSLSPTTIQDAELQDREIQIPTGESEISFKQTTTSISADNNETKKAQEVSKANESPLVQPDHIYNTPSPSSLQDGAMGAEEICETMERPLVEADHNSLSPTAIQDAELHDREIQISTGESETSFKQTTNSISADNKETKKAQEVSKANESLLVQPDHIHNTPSPSSLQDGGSNGSAMGAEEICETIERPLVEADQNSLSPTAIQDAELHDREIQILTGESENSFKQTTISISADNTETKKAQEVSKANESPLIQPDHIHNTPNPSSLQDGGSEQSPSEAETSYTTYRGMFDISLENLPFLEAEIERHPHVLEWVNENPKRRGRGVLASSAFSLFADVTRMLRTTRRRDLTQDDRHYITQCCTTLQSLGFDASWLAHVDRCIQRCGGAEMLNDALEETQAKAFNLKLQLQAFKDELASLEASLLMLRQKAALDHFIDA